MKIKTQFKLICFFLLIILAACVAKTKSKEQTKSEIKVSGYTENQVAGNLQVKTDKEFEGFTSAEIASFASLWRFGYDGAQGEGFRMFVNKTDKGFEVGAEGKGTASAEGESKQEKNVQETHMKESFDSLSAATIKLQNKYDHLEKKLDEELKKKKFSIDVPPGVYIVAGLLLFVALVLWWFFGRPKERLKFEPYQYPIPPEKK